MNTETIAKNLAKQYGRAWADMGAYEREDYMDEARRFEDQNYDGAPYCQFCRALTRKGCDCGPIADNN